MLRRGVAGNLGAGAALGIALLAGACASSPTASTHAAQPPSPSVTSTAGTNSGVVKPARPGSLPAFPSTPWAFEDKTGQLITTPHYRLYTTTDQPMILERMPAFLEAALAHYRSSLSDLPEPPAALESYLLANRPQWARVTQRLMGTRAEPFLRIQRGGFATQGQAVLYDVGIRDTFSLAAHEGWHQYTQRTFQAPLPTWLEEGIASYMEGFRWDPKTSEAIFQPWNNLERFEQLRQTHAAGQLMSIRELLSTSPQQLLGAGRLKQSGADAALTYYAQVWSLVHFLREGADGKYRERFASLLNDAAKGTLNDRLTAAGAADLTRSYMLPRRGVDFLRATMGADMAQFQSEYEAFVDRLVAPGAKQKVVAGESPIAK